MGKKGKFIVLEGIDGSGKTTVGQKITVELMKNYKEATVFTREPRNDELGRLIRQYVTGEKKIYDEYTIQVLNMASRLEHLADHGTGIKKMIDGGCNVICDRFMLSTVVYACYEQVGKWWKLLNNEEIPYPVYKAETEAYIANQVSINQDIMSSYKDILDNMITIYLKVNPATSLERVTARTEDGGDTISIYETHDRLVKLSETYDIASEVMRFNNHPVIEVDANKSADEVYHTLLAICKDIINS